MTQLLMGQFLMYDLCKIDLGMDEAEKDQRLQEYFLKTGSYQKALEGKKTIILGRKGSGKSAIQPVYHPDAL